LTHNVLAAKTAHECTSGELHLSRASIFSANECTSGEIAFESRTHFFRKQITKRAQNNGLLQQDETA
jgi:hypothetical protein